MAKDLNIWPMAPVVVGEDVRALITRFFEISNSTDPNSGKWFAEELFTIDGLFKTHETCVFQGREAIASSRGNNSPLITSRSYKLIKAFASNSPATDIVVLGSFTVGLIDGSETTFDFTARFVIRSQETTTEGRFEMVQVWTDPTKMREAFEMAAAAQRAEGSQHEH